APRRHDARRVREDADRSRRDARAAAAALPERSGEHRRRASAEAARERRPLPEHPTELEEEDGRRRRSGVVCRRKRASRPPRIPLELTTMTILYDAATANPGGHRDISTAQLAAASGPVRVVD